MSTTPRPLSARRVWSALALAGCTAVIGVTGWSAASATPSHSVDAAAYRVAGLETRTARNPSVGLPNHVAVKKVTVACPRGKVVLGGEVVPQEHTANGYPVFVDDSQLALAQSEPGILPDGRHTWTGKVAETSVGSPYRWNLTVTATCATPPPRYDLVSMSTDVSDDTVQEAHADCVDGRTVLGSGARVRSLADNPGVSLQVNRVDALGGLVRAQAAAHPSHAEPPQWGLTSVAICADRPSGWRHVNGLSPVDPAVHTEVARVTCPAGTRALSPGGALSGHVNGRAGLTTLTTATTRGVEHFRSGDSWRPVLARTICSHADLEDG